MVEMHQQEILVLVVVEVMVQVMVHQEHQDKAQMVGMLQFLLTNKVLVEVVLV